jgi:hypothetical protein
MPGPALLPSPAFPRGGQKSSKSKPPRQLFKSLSTPHLRGRLTMSEAELAKRNKLGYQRISIACGTCCMTLYHTTRFYPALALPHLIVAIFIQLAPPHDLLAMSSSLTDIFQPTADVERSAAWSQRTKLTAGVQTAFD